MSQKINGSSRFQRLSSSNIDQGSLLRWFLVFTKPAGEAKAQVNLERQGYKVYYPRLLQPSLHKGRWIERIVSLFPRYLFVQLDSARQSLAPIRSTLGVATIVRFGHQSAVVPNEVIKELMHSADPESGLHKLRGARTLERGAPVSVIAGAFEGLRGIFEREVGQERVLILLRVLGADTAVRIPSQYIAPAGPG